MMLRLYNYASLGLASCILLVGCGKSPAPTTAQRNQSRRPAPRLEPALLSADLVVAAAHVSSVDSNSYPHSDYANGQRLQTLQPSPRRLPPIPPTPQYPNTAQADHAPAENPYPVTTQANGSYPHTNNPRTNGPSTSYPDSADYHNKAAELQRLPATQVTRERLPSIEPIPNVSLLPAITSARATLAVPVSLVPAAESPQPQEDAESRLPQRRVVPQQPAKPPLPPMASAASRVLGGAGSIDTTAALASVADRVDQMTNRAFALAEKGALYSAKAEFHQALRAIAQSLGAQTGSKEYSMAMARGLQALEEADDFAMHSQNGPVVNVGRIVDAHQTPLLKPYDLSEVPPVVAMQRYYTYAQDQLLLACGGAPVAARVFYGLGKLHMVLGEESATAERLHGPKAMAFQQTALLIDPTNFLAANELGVLLARFGKFDQARTVLQHSLAIRPLPETWRNLSVVHRELGETQLAAQSHANWQFAVQQSQQNSGAQPSATGGSLVQWVPPQQFMGMPGGPTAMPPPSQAAPLPPTPPQSAARQAGQTPQKTGFLWW